METSLKHDFKTMRGYDLVDIWLKEISPDRPDSRQLQTLRNIASQFIIAMKHECDPTDPNNSEHVVKADMAKYALASYLNDFLTQDVSLAEKLKKVSETFRIVTRE